MEDYFKALVFALSAEDRQKLLQYAETLRELDKERQAQLTVNEK